MRVEKASFGSTEEGAAVDIYTLTNVAGMQVKISNYGGTITSILVPDQQGRKGEVMLGFDYLAQYEQQSPYFGCIVGRYANRIGNARFTLGSKEYVLAKNDGDNHLHGGMRGFDKVVWQGAEFQTAGSVGLELKYQSQDGEENYPGTLDVQVIYRLENDNTLAIEYEATTDRETIVNLTNHTYFNLAGGGDILGHILMLNAGSFTPINETLIPTGEIKAVKGTPLDFTSATRIGARIDDKAEQLQFAGGYDHNWVLSGEGDAPSLAAVVSEPTSGRILEVYTTEPGIQFYSGNFLNSSLSGRGGAAQQYRGGFCLEPQHFPDSPNKSYFPSTILRPDETYRQITLYKFPKPI